jgi:hypothetical protein
MKVPLLQSWDGIAYSIASRISVDAARFNFSPLKLENHSGCADASKLADAKRKRRKAFKAPNDQ